jgi:hypothetical protein
MSYMEVYNEQVCDLLEVANKNLPLREDPDRGIVIVAGLSEHKVSSYDEVLELLMKGQVNRKTEATKANIVSSRSHAILQFTITHARRGANATNVTSEAKLSLIDLAGSERASATQNTGARLQEGANINKSLLALANCINALSEGAACSSAPAFGSPRKSKKLNVKYRDSKLTHLLKGSLEGNCNLIMIANINPADTTHDDTYRTLQYANRAKNLKVKPSIKEVGAEVPAAEREARLKEENEELRLKLALLEQNAQQANSSEKQLLQALAQAMQELTEAKAHAASPTRSRSPLLRGAVAVAQGIRSSLSAATSPLRSSPTPKASAFPVATGRTSPVRTASPVRSPAPPAPVPMYNVFDLDAAMELETSHSPYRPTANAETSPLCGKKTKRDSDSSEMSRLSEVSYNPRGSMASVMRQSIYGADGEGSDQEQCGDENQELAEWRRQSEGNKSRRTSAEHASPRKPDAGAQRPMTRLSSGSTQPQGRTQAQAPQSQRSGRLSGTRLDCLSSGSVNGSTRSGQDNSNSAVPAFSFVKPSRLSEELVRQYEVLANVTSAANRRFSNEQNLAAAEGTTTTGDKTKGRESFSSENGAGPSAAPNGRGSFPSAVHGTQWAAADANNNGGFSVDPRFRYSHGVRDTTPPKQGFLKRFLCGLNKRR